MKSTVVERLMTLRDHHTYEVETRCSAFSSSRSALAGRSARPPALRPGARADLFKAVAR